LVKTGSNDALSVVRAYHESWTTKHFDDATRLLARDLKVEVPVNDYPTAESFAQALSGFGSLVKRVELLAEFTNGDEAMLLYDMDVEKIGALRVAEHFTVEQGRISKIRQIHDTTAIRAAGFVRA
jgi:ketosteroid isomerase-like protein